MWPKGSCRVNVRTFVHPISTCIHLTLSWRPESHTLGFQLAHLFNPAALSAVRSLDQTERVGVKDTIEGLVSGCKGEGVNCQSGRKEGTVHFQNREG